MGTHIKAPVGAVIWSISNADTKKRLTFADDSGLGVSEWPVSECTVENIRERWGAGRYQAHWFSDKKGVKGPKGSSGIFTVAPEAARVPEERPSPVVQQVAPQQQMPGPLMDPMFQMMVYFEEKAKRDQEYSARSNLTQMQGFAQLIATMQGAVPHGPPAGMSELSNAVAQIASTVGKLAERIEEMDQYDDEDDEDDDEDSEIIKDGSLNTDMIMNKGIAKIPDLLDAAGQFMKSRAEESNARRTASSPPPAPIPNAGPQTNNEPVSS